MGAFPDDAFTGVAMGTPGERIDIGEIVSGANSDETPLQQPHTSVQGLAVVPAVRPSTDMTVLGLLPHYSALVNYDVSTTATSKFNPQHKLIRFCFGKITCVCLVFLETSEQKIVITSYILETNS